MTSCQMDFHERLCIYDDIHAYKIIQKIICIPPTTFEKWPKNGEFQTCLVLCLLSFDAILVRKVKQTVRLMWDDKIS